MAGKLEELRVFYEDLYACREPSCNLKSKIEKLNAQLDTVTHLTAFSQSNPVNKPVTKSNKFTCLKVVSDFIKGIPNKTSAGPDSIPNTVIKKLPYSCLFKLTQIFNHCINNSYFPSSWKSATIIPIPKKTGILEPKEFRPISMTSNLGKILEDSVSKIIKAEMGEGTIPWTQFGFREGHSTVDALTVFKREIDNCISRREFLAVVSLDIKKAFDSVWHKGLVYKVHKAGCDLNTAKMVQSFLNNRVAMIKVDGLHSKELRINRGVPQGTRLGPLLYNIYTGDLNLDLSPRERLQTYADDTLLSYCSINAFHATQKVAERIDAVDKYLNNWGIEINAEKNRLYVG